jgi:hypothetical protein
MAARRKEVRITYETNGKGYLGWIEDYPGAFLRGPSLEEARAKLDRELGDYADWLGLPAPLDGVTTEPGAPGMPLESIVTSALAIEDADSNFTFGSELVDYEDADFERFMALLRRSARMVAACLDSTRNRGTVDPHHDRMTFYGHAYATIDEQFEHIVKVQDYYLGMVGEALGPAGGIVETREAMVAKLAERRRAEGNALHVYEGESWTIRKIIRRTIWHDRIHARAMKRMDERLSRGD